MPDDKRSFRIVSHGGGWAVETDGRVGDLAYVTKEAAFEAIIGAAEVAMLEGLGITISVPPGAEGRWA